MPIPKRLFVTSQNSLALFCAIVVPFENKIEPLVNVGKLNLLLKVVQSVLLRNPVTEAVALAGVVHVGVPAPWLVKNCPAVPAKLFGFNAPLKRILPVTSNFSVGAELLIPT